MRKTLIYLLLIIGSLVLGWELNVLYRSPQKGFNPIAQIKPRTLDKYTIENLAKATVTTAKIEIGETLKENKDFTSRIFTFSFDPTLSGKAAKKVSGLINIPKGTGPFPVIVMFRGYVDQKIYKTGMGTERSGEFFAKNGFITVAPDFLGFGSSDSESADIFESRFQTYTTAVVLLHSIEELSFAKATEGKWDGKNIAIWGHSNGGHIALVALEISGKAYPAVLWAPVSAPFPYSILYYLDEAEDGGKLIIQKLSDFFELYDPKLYSANNYYAKISTASAVQINQGTADDAVPVAWSQALLKSLRKLNIKTDYLVYPGADHNLQPDWQLAVTHSLTFFKNNLY